MAGKSYYLVRDFEIFNNTSEILFISKITSNLHRNQVNDGVIKFIHFCCAQHV